MPRGGKAKKVKYKGKTYSTATSGGGASPRDIARAIQLGQIALQAAAEKARKEELRKKNLEKQQRVARAAKRKPEDHQGGNAEYRDGWLTPVGGFDAQGRKVTVSFGTGKNEGETLISDGWTRDPERFMDGKDDNRKRLHNHYGDGSGRHHNADDRGRYHGEGA